MGSRGTYRAVYSSLVDDPDFQRLSARARLVFLVARVCKQAGPAAIFRYYTELLMAQTGLTKRELAGALDDLVAGQWIDRDADVLWIRNGLRYDPSITLANPRHRRSVESTLAALPKSPVVLRFCIYYDLPKPFDSPSIAMPFPEPDSRNLKPEKQPPPLGVALSSSDGFLEQLRNNPAYKHIDLDRELSKMDAWLSTPAAKGRKKTPRFIVNWLNRIEPPQPPSGPILTPRTQGNIAAMEAVVRRLKGATDATR